MTTIETMLVAVVLLLALGQIAMYIKMKTRNPNHEEFTMIRFYDVQDKCYVHVADNKCKKVIYFAGDTKHERYAVKAVSANGHKLTLFISKARYDELTRVKPQ